MGVRNPFRMEVDPATNSVSWGDYGPDAGAPSAERGPMGYVEWMTTGIDKPINAGWPYCTGNQFNYNEWNFATATPGEFFDCAAGAENNSRWNTGLDTVPPATPATLYYGDNNTHQPWPELTDFSPAGGQGPMGGPVYHFDADNPSTTKFPEYWDDKAFFAEFSQDYLAVFDVQWPNGPVDHITNFLPNAALETNGQAITDSPIDIEFGPDGSLYVLDYGDGFFRANPDAGLYRIDYSPGNKAPTARISADPISSSGVPLTVDFDGSDSTDPEGGALTYEWDFTGDGTFDATGVDGDPHLHDAGQVHRPPAGHRPAGPDRHHEHVDQRRQRRTDRQRQHPQRRLLRLGPGRAGDGHDHRPRGRDRHRVRPRDLDLRSRPRRPRPPAEPGHGMPVRDPHPGRRDPARRDGEHLRRRRDHLHRRRRQRRPGGDDDSR